jgi:murein L,D-transpeptidase YcbB/YkuD
MDINSTAAVWLRASRRAAKIIALISVVTCVAVTGFAAAVHGFTEAPATQPVTAVGGDEVPARSVTVPADNGAVPADNTAAPAPMPAPVVADANAPIVALLRELANGKFDRIVGGQNNRPVFDAYYAAHGYAPIWITDGKFNERAAAAIAYLGQVDADGLDPADYPVPSVSASTTDPAALAEAEMRLSASVVTYAHHASVGRVHWSHVSSSILYEVKPPTPAAVLAAVADAKDVAATLAGYEPQAPNYIALKAKLADLRAGKTGPGKTPIANGPTPKIGAQDDRVPRLRERFNGRSPNRPIDTVLANLERWRWMPHDLGKDYVIVNLPDFTLRVFHDGRQIWMTRIVTGKPTMATPIMSAEMKYITVNPTWHVPQSIVQNEYLPALAQDPTVLDRMGLRVSYNGGRVEITQPPGEGNALGRLRFNFPNRFSVYHHDTPDKQLFAQDFRAYSHGCMRVQDPAKYAEVLLNVARPREHWTAERIKSMFGAAEQDIQLQPTPIWVHLTYQTALGHPDQ